jgi:hypothetical protein
MREVPLLSTGIPNSDWGRLIIPSKRSQNIVENRTGGRSAPATVNSSVRTREYLTTERHDLLRLLPHPARKPHNAQDPRHHAHPRPSRRHDRRPGRL